MTNASSRRPGTPSLVARLPLAIWRRARRLPPRDLLTTLRAAIVLTAVESTIRWVTLPRLSRALGVRLELQPGAASSSQVPLDELPLSARRSLEAAQRVTRHWPFCSGPCLRSALVGGHLIRDLAPAIRIGIGARDAGIGAHAWIEIDGRPLEDVSDLRAFQRTVVADRGLSA